MEFSGHLHVITGETGAGKSIIAGALGLILGERADSSVLVNKDRKCVVEGLFPARGSKAIRTFFTEQDLELEEEIVIRREISTSGKSRAFINDTPVTLQALSKLGNLLVDLHRQFDTLELGESSFQRDVVDALAENGERLQHYQDIFSSWKKTLQALHQLQEKQQQLEKEKDFNQFLFQELDEAAFRDNEVEEAAAELKMLDHAEGIHTALSRISESLDEGEQPLVQQLRSLVQQLQPWAPYHPGIEPLLSRLQSLHIELKDLSADTEKLARTVENDPEKQARLNERISLGNKLMKKHGVQSTTGLLEVAAALEKKLQDVQQLDEEILQLQKQAAATEAQAMEAAAVLSAARKKVLAPFAEKVNKLLGQVGMPNARMKTELQKVALHEYGYDAVEFLFNANIPSGKEAAQALFQPLQKVASGGELSRLMLCIKSLLAKSVNLPTLIFDEIDTGISGEAARQVGILLKDLAAGRQVICITHQPQIAGKADRHFYVYKEIEGDQVKTRIRLLNTEERITAIARMLSGEKPTAAALQNAREMVMN